MSVQETYVNFLQDVNLKSSIRMIVKNCRKESIELYVSYGGKKLNISYQSIGPINDTTIVLDPYEQIILRIASPNGSCWTKGQQMTLTCLYNNVVIKISYITGAQQQSGEFTHSIYKNTAGALSKIASSEYEQITELSEKSNVPDLPSLSSEQSPIPEQTPIHEQSQQPIPEQTQIPEQNQPVTDVPFIDPEVILFLQNANNEHTKLKNDIVQLRERYENERKRAYDTKVELENTQRKLDSFSEIKKSLEPSLKKIRLTTKKEE